MAQDLGIDSFYFYLAPSGLRAHVFLSMARIHTRYSCYNFNYNTHKYGRMVLMCPPNRGLCPLRGTLFHPQLQLPSPSLWLGLKIRAVAFQGKGPPGPYPSE